MEFNPELHAANCHPVFMKSLTRCAMIVFTPMKRTLLLLCFLLFGACLQAAHAQSTIFVSRHADRYGSEPDPSLTPAGEKQAKALAQLLCEANVRHIFTTELIRTRQTAEPLARLIQVTPEAVPQANFDELIQKVRAALQPNQSILVVGHRETVPKIVHVLTGKEIAPIRGDEYGRLIAITMFPDGSSSVVTLRYAP
jgi:phosphohistidine phosphatase SixA